MQPVYIEVDQIWKDLLELQAHLNWMKYSDKSFSVVEILRDTNLKTFWLPEKAIEALKAAGLVKEVSEGRFKLEPAEFDLRLQLGKDNDVQFAGIRDGSQRGTEPAN